MGWVYGLSSQVRIGLMGDLFSTFGVLNLPCQHTLT